MSFLIPRRPQGSSGAISAVDPHSPPWGPRTPMGGCGGPHGGPHEGAPTRAGACGGPHTPSALVFFLAREGVEPDGAPSLY